ncbi:CBASS cGAMP synthase [Acinetobacter pittii]|jgi:hypothetical protein|uniref:CBASS cGAMP synthase n=1 Tax=Acinetobacter pittii TaxID=48296 RepID=UPI000E5A356C|nr:hypothetical protein [Acinetobacter pittii]MBQ5174786.1 hypothetical protein [Acinetobacter pittii]MDH0178718.1 CBASS cGAMP synthase [Acinetobacter pittii]MDH0691116.1 CBASS cGAMP synthase [Acinetobacter pittii]MDP7814756.1 CBASS cGAMP synthase [Acinetobacter pittii]QHQ33187.1 hypothetical protein EPY81_18210 [Acinetobacter pittii]
MPSNLHRTFRAKEDGFITKIKPTLSQRDYLNDCRQKVRSTLKEGMRDFIIDNAGDPTIIKPKFRLQGSWAYGTCNQPAHPNQEMDIDYGIYLPSSLLTFGRSDKVAKAYFKAVESLLAPLALKEGWKLCDDKNTCCRLILNSNAHMDVPLYIVPDRMFDSLVEQNFMALDSAKSANIGDKYIFKGYQYAAEGLENESKLIRLDEITKIHMALRDGSWKDSDCELIRKWYADQLATQPDNGRQLRYIARYLKAWRDFEYNEGGGPSSILLMIIANKYYQFFDKRDDLALLSVLEYLPKALLGEVKEPSIPQHTNEDFNRIPENDRQMAYSLALELYQTVSTAKEIERPKTSISFLKTKFGNRIPSDESYIEIDNPDPNPPLRTSTPADIQPIRGG